MYYFELGCSVFHWNCRLQWAVFQTQTGKKKTSYSPSDTESWSRILCCPLLLYKSYLKIRCIYEFLCTLLSFSSKDVITDLTADCETLDIDGVHSFQAHKGMVQAAKYVKATLENQHILEQAFDRAQVGVLQCCLNHTCGRFQHME